MTTTTATVTQVDREAADLWKSAWGSFADRLPAEDLAYAFARHRLASSPLQVQGQTDALREALEPVLHWYQSDEHEDRPLLDIVRDVVADLQQDRKDALKLTALTATHTVSGMGVKGWPTLAETYIVLKSLHEAVNAYRYGGIGKQAYVEWRVEAEKAGEFITNFPLAALTATPPTILTGDAARQEARAHGADTFDGEPL